MNRNLAIGGWVWLGMNLWASAGLSAIPAWTRWEQELAVDEPINEAQSEPVLKVTYSGPSGERFTGLGFRDGDKAFRIRCFFPSAGNWTWRTECSETNLASLHNRSGTVEVQSYTGANPLYRHGYLHVSANGRYLEHGDGTPFLWLGDTAWAAPMNASISDWQVYLRDRREKGFTGIQVFCASDWAGSQDTDGHTPFFGEGLERPNPAYWQQYDRKVQLANEEGMVVLVVGLMEPVRRYPDATSAQHFARYLVARMMGSHVIFSPSFDSPYMELGDAVGESVREATALHLITQHPGTDLPAAQKYQSKGYADIAGLQSGAGWGGNPLSAETVAKNAVEWSLDLYAHRPAKPVINLECRYDSEFNQKQLMRLPRSCGYWTLLSGCAGYTYGCAGLWNWGLKITHGDPQASLWDWRGGMEQASSMDMKHLGRLFGSLEWWRLEPHHELVLNPSRDPTRRMVLAKSVEGDLVVAYLPDNPEIVLHPAAFRGLGVGRWFDPRSGEYGEAKAVVGDSPEIRFSRPAEWEDAVLVWRSAAAGRP